MSATLAVVALWLVVAWLLLGAVVQLLTVGRSRRPLTVRESVTLAGLRVGMALAVALAAVWVVLTR